MRRPPAGKLVILKEQGEFTPPEQITIPPIIPTLANTFRNSNRIASSVVGFPEFVRESDARLTALGR